MHTQSIPHTQLTPSCLCLGTGDLGGSIDQSTSFRLIDAFFEAGGTFLDSAKVYADWLPGERSSSEKTIGRWLKSRGCRNIMVIATKGAHPDLASMHIPRMSQADIQSDAESSLKSLGIERIDLYYLHRDDPQREVGEILEALEGLVKAGKIRYYGCSNWRPERIRQSRLYSAAHNLQGFSANQPMWSLAYVEYANLMDPTLAVMDDDMLSLHRETQLACVPYTSQANGFFQKMEAGRERNLSEGQRRMFLTPENRTRFERLKEVKRQTGLSTTQIAIGSLFSHPFPVFPIVGPKTFDHLHDTLSAADVKLSPEQVTFLEHGSQG